MLQESHGFGFGFRTGSPCRSGVFTICLILLLSQVKAQTSSHFDKSYRQKVQILDSLIRYDHLDLALLMSGELEEQYRTSANWPALVRTLSYSARAHLNWNDFALAHVFLQEGDQIANQYLSDDHPERGILWHQWGVFYAGVGSDLFEKLYGEHDRDSLVNTCFENALRVLEGCCPERHELLGDLWMDYARNKEDATVKFNLLDSAINHFAVLEKGVNLGHVKALILLARGKRGVGETELSYELTRTAASIMEQIHAPPHQVLQDLDIEIAERLYRDDKSLEALAVNKRLFDRELAYPYPDPARLARYRMDQGKCYLEMDSSNSLQVFLDAEKLMLRAPDIDYKTLGLIHWYIGYHYRTIKEFDTARAWYSLSTEDFRKGGDISEISANLRYEAELSLEMDLPEEALIYVDECLELAGFTTGEFANGSLLYNRNIDDFFDPLELKGRILYAQFEKTGDSDYLYQSLQISQAIEQMAEQVRSGLYSESTNLVVSEHFHRAAAGALRTLSALVLLDTDPELKSQAFNFIEHNRYAQLYKEWEKAEHESSSGVPDSLTSGLRFFRSEIDRLERKRSKVEGRDQQITQDSLYQVQQSYSEIRSRIESEYPAYFQIRYDNMITLSEAQELLDPQSQMIEFLWEDDWITIFSYNRDTSQLVTIPDSSVKAGLDRILPWITKGVVADTDDLSFTEFASSAHRLHDSLVKPYVDTSRSKLVLSPDGDLAYLPFEVLLMGEGSGFASAPYLIHEWECQYIHSVNVLKQSDHLGVLNHPDLLAMAYSSEDDETVSATTGFNEIPHSGAEVTAIKETFDQARITQLKGNAATKRSLMEAITEFDIVHLAVHGVGGGDDTEESHLIFKSEDEANDGYLYSNELYPLNLQKLKLAVLSACETGRGEAMEGEGVFSIARGFAYAGTPSLVMSLWEADDLHTARIMQSFYEHFNQGYTVGASIRQAKLDFLKGSNNIEAIPYNWAAFIPMGDASLHIDPSTPSWTYWVLGLFVFLVFILGLRWRNRSLHTRGSDHGKT